MFITLTLNGKSSILTAEYFPPITLEGEYNCTLVDFQTYNSIPNIDEDNNKFFIGDKSIILPTGSCEIEDIEDFVKKKLEISNTKEEKSKLFIKTNNNTLNCEIFSDEEIDFEREGTTGKLLGFSKKILKPNIWDSSDLAVDINKINII